MKDLLFYDSRHATIYLVKNPKSRIDAHKRLIKELVPKTFTDVQTMQGSIFDVESEIKEIP